MPFASYSTIGDVARAHRIHFVRSDFIVPIDGTLGDAYRSELQFTLDEVSFDATETIIRETLIYPLLREVWKPFRQSLTLWSNQPITYDDDLCGVPDYTVARRSPLGFVVFDAPYLIIVEAKRDDFIRGWGQCLAAMVAAQRINDLPEQTLYGIATNGRIWQFGRLRGTEFTQELRLFALSELDTLAGALRFAFTECQEQVQRMPAMT